ncbi:MAG TPA: glycosyltransferase family 4 protein [Vicinamibacterales bacterium]|nr:glycosyltransferase family 4 protein [Vicinamibacterales bacterium]
MRVVQVNYPFDAALPTAGALLDRYATLTGWAEAIAGAGANVLTVQRFGTSSNVTRAGLPYTFGTFNEIAEATLRFRPDIVHVNGLEFPIWTWELRRWLAPRTAIVVQSHADGGTVGRAPRLAGAATRRVADALLFAVPEHAQTWRDAGLVARGTPVFAVMPASTSIRAVDRDAARSASGVTGDPAVLWVGRLNANKDPLTVLDGFERFASRATGATLSMVYHDGDLAAAVRARVLASDALRGRVRLVGEVPHDRIATFFSAADIFVVGSHHEGSGYALMEALACGATAVVSEIPTFRALVSGTHPSGTGDGPELYPSRTRVGHLWPPGDADACARALERAAATADRQHVIDHFERNLTWDAVGKRAVEIYGEVSSAKGDGRREQGIGNRE